MRELDQLERAIVSMQESGDLEHLDEMLRLITVALRVQETEINLLKNSKPVITLRERASQLESIGMLPVEFDLANEGMKIDREVAREAECPQCGKKSMLYQPFTGTGGRLGASVAYCAEDYASISF